MESIFTMLHWSNIWHKHMLWRASNWHNTRYLLFYFRHQTFISKNGTWNGILFRTKPGDKLKQNVQEYYNRCLSFEYLTVHWYSQLYMLTTHINNVCSIGVCREHRKLNSTCSICNTNYQFENLPREHSMGRIARLCRGVVLYGGPCPLDQCTDPADHRPSGGPVQHRDKELEITACNRLVDHYVGYQTRRSIGRAVTLFTSESSSNKRVCELSELVAKLKHCKNVVTTVNKLIVITVSKYIVHLRAVS